MEYRVTDFSVNVCLDENAIDNLLSEAEEWLEPYENMSYRRNSNTICVDAFNMTNGDSRLLIEIDLSEYTYVEVYD